MRNYSLFFNEESIKKLSTDELLLIVRRRGEAGQAAFAILSERYSALILGTVASFHTAANTANAANAANAANVAAMAGNIEREDMLQEANIALFDAAVTYKHQNSVSFGLYAKICINNRIISRLRASGGKYRETSSLEQLREMGICTECLTSADPDPSNLVIEKENFKSLKSLIHRNLSKYENKVFSLYMQGHPAKDIAALVEKPHKSIDNAICRIRAKLKKILL